MMKKLLPGIAAAVLLLYSQTAYPLNSAPPEVRSSWSDLEAKIQEANSFYAIRTKAIDERFKNSLGVSPSEALQKQRELLQELNQKAAMLARIDDLGERQRQMKALKSDPHFAELEKTFEIYYNFQNEIEKDHEFIGRLLSQYEAILNELIQQEPFFRRIFSSEAYRREHGLVLVRVVWKSDLGEDISGETTPLSVHSLFSDQSKTPLLVKLTPLAFRSLSFLHSILIHELNHVSMLRDPVFQNVKNFSGSAVNPASAILHYFSKLNPNRPSYQFYLIHEYYSFKTQMDYDDGLPQSSVWKLSEAHRKYFEQFLTWTFGQLNVSNQEFIKTRPVPPLLQFAAISRSKHSI